MNFYIVLDTHLAALEPSLTVFTLTRQTENWPLIDISMTQEDKGEFLNNLEQQEILIYEQEFLDINSVNELGLKKAAGYVIECLIPKLICKIKQKPQTIYRNQGCPPSVFYRCKLVSYTAQPTLLIGKYINLFKRKWWVERYYHPNFPKYNWISNLGSLNREHALTILDEGLTPYHINEGLKRIPWYWLQELKANNPKYLFGEDYLNSPPFWWSLLFKCHFTEFLNEYDKRIAAALATGYTSKSFDRYLKRSEPNYARLSKGVSTTL